MEIVVDLSRIRHNIRRIRRALGVGYCAVVKADAYGHGAAIAPYIAPLSDCFMTATHREAQTVAAYGTGKPVLTMDCDISGYMREPDSCIIPAVSYASDAEALIRRGCTRFSVAVDTGMNRSGAKHNELKKIVSLCKSRDIAPWSVYSHIYNGMSSAREQSEAFDAITKKESLLCRRRHIFSSCALDYDGGLYDMARVGIAMYGYHDGLDTAMRARARIVRITHVNIGEHIGYGDTVADRDMTVATVRCGYADGLRRTRRPMYMRVRGNKCAVIGVACMDLCMIDVTGVPARPGEYAYYIAEKSDAEYLADVYDTNVYEVLTGLNGRAERIYV